MELGLDDRSLACALNCWRGSCGFDVSLLLELRDLDVPTY